MAVKASQTITLFKSVDVSAVTLYFKTVNAGSAAPAKPTTATPSGWSTSEPTLNISKDLYATLKSTFTDGSFSYSTPQKYSSYEAAKTAYNTANAANTNANTALSRSVEKSTTAPSDTNRIWLDLTTGLLKQYVVEQGGTGSWVVVNDYSSDISGLAGDISSWNSALTKQSEDLKKYADEVTQTTKTAILEQTSEDINMQFTAKTKTITQTLTGIQTKLKTQDSYINFADGIITLGETGKEYTLKIDNDNITIYYNDAAISSWKQDIFQAKEIDIGPYTWNYGFAFVPNTDGSLSFRKIERTVSS
jgi:hypothetical protein